jgi:hypothetical protein
MQLRIWKNIQSLFIGVTYPKKKNDCAICHKDEGKHLLKDMTNLCCEACWRKANIRKNRGSRY